MTTAKQRQELTNAAYAVACSPSIGAYGSKYTSKPGVWMSDLRRLLEALSALDLTPEAREQVDGRLAAIRRHN